MKNRSLVALLLALLAAVVLSACGGGGGGGGGGAAGGGSQPTKAVLKLYTAGSTTLISSVTVTIKLPAGVTAKSTTAPPETDPGVAFPSGNAASSTSGVLFISTYSTASGTTLGRVKALLGNGDGFSNGEFMTIVFDIAPGKSPTAADFIVEISAGDRSGAAIPGVTATKGVALVGSSTPTMARMKLISSGTTTTIGAIDVTIALPAGVTVKSTIKPPETDAGVVFPSGFGVGSLMAATYSAASGTVRVTMMNASGFSAGEFATVMCDLAGGIRPVSSDFTINSPSVTGLYSLSTITGAAVTTSITLE